MPQSDTVYATIINNLDGRDSSGIIRGQLPFDTGVPLMVTEYTLMGACF